MHRFDRRRSSTPVLLLLTGSAIASITAVTLAGESTVLSFPILLFGLIALVMVGRQHLQTTQHLSGLQDVLHAAPSGLLCVNTHGTILFANPTAAHIFNYTTDELVGMSVEQLIPSDTQGPDSQVRHQLLVEKRSRRMGEGRDISGITRDGVEVPLEIGLTFLGEGDNALIIVGVIDISELKEAQHIIQRQNVHLERSVRELEQFSFSASHDLREPLRKVMNYIEILQEDYAGVLEDEGKTLQSMAGAVQRMERLLDSLLTYSRVTTKAQPFDTVALDSVLADVLEDLSLAISEAHARIELAPLPVVLGDRNQLRQLFQNLVSNSLKYRHQQLDPVIRIYEHNAVAPNHDRNLRCIVVRDNGIGFDSQYRDIIFNVFKRLHGRDQYPGTGMGLAICRKIVDRHEGFIQAEGEPGKGATFTIWLKGKK